LLFLFLMKSVMRYVKIILGAILLMPLFFACNSKLDVNADWKDITIVYGILNQNDTVHYFKITKAFLGDGNALAYAQIPDSSYYKDSLEVKMEEYVDNNLQSTLFNFQTVITTDKDSGIFYSPNQLLFKTSGHLNENALYKLIIRNKKTNKLVTSQTAMIHHFEIDDPQALDQASFISTANSKVIWYSAIGGKRYQLNIRFHYIETLISDTSNHVEKYVDWTAFKDVKSVDALGGRKMEFLIPGNSFFQVVGSHVAESNLYNRLPRDVEYIFSVDGDDMNTYLEVTEPTTGIIQERPSFSNITNGIGLFSCTYNNRKDNPLVLRLSARTLAELKTNPLTANRGF
jgi:hypothetical protein